jgi:hypothetical protein
MDSSLMQATTEAGSFRIDVLNRQCSVIGATAHERAWLRDLWGYEAPEVPTSPTRIEICFTTAPPPTVSGEYHDLVLTALHDVALTWRRLGERSWYTGSETRGVQLTIEPSLVQVLVWRRSDFEGSGLVSYALHVALCEALRASGLIPLHAAVAERDGRAIAFTGRSGVGKSTMLLRAVEQGWVPVSEDFAWLDPKTCHVFRFDRGIRLTNEAVRARDPLKHEVWQQHRDGKMLLRYQHIAPPSARAATLTRVVELHRDETRATEWISLDLREAVQVWYECTGVAMCIHNRNTISALVAPLLSRVPTSRLNLGPTEPQL